MAQISRVLLAFVLLSASFAGCIGADDDGQEQQKQAADTSFGKQKPEGQQDSLGWIYGVITDMGTGVPVPNVNVSLSQGLGSALTNETGAYVITNVPRGEYVVDARAPDYLLSRYAISVFADEGTEMNFKLQPTDGAGTENLTPVLWTDYFFKETSGADYIETPGALAIEKPEGEAAVGGLSHPQTGGFGTNTLPADQMGGRPAATMKWEVEFTEDTTLHADTENPVAFPDPSFPGDGIELVRYNAMHFKLWTWDAVPVGFLRSIKVEDVAPDGSTELLSLRSEFVEQDEDPSGTPVLMDYDMPFLKRGKEFHTFQAGHKLRVSVDDSNAWWVVYWFDGEQFPAGLSVRKGPFLEPPKAGDRLVLTYEGHTRAGASNPYGVAWFVDIPPEADPLLEPTGIHRTNQGGYYVGTACPDYTSDSCVGDSTIYFDVPQGAQTVYTRLEFSEPPVRDPSSLFNDYDILLFEPSGKAHTHTAGYGANQAELQFHDVFETPEWPQQWWVEIFAFLVVESDWTATVEIVF